MARPPKLDVAAMISSIQLHGMGVSQIARDVGISRNHVWRLRNGATRAPSYDVGVRLVTLHEAVVAKAGPPAGVTKKG